MATKKGTTAKKGGTKAKHSKPNKKPTTALILFAVSLFVLAITFIPGENFWNDLKNFFFGLFGVLTYIFPFYLLAISVFYAMDKLNGLTLVRFVETAVLIFLVQGAIDIFVSNPTASETYTQHLAAVYQSGSALKSGGFIGGLIGWPLSSFGKAGAIATVFLLIFVFLMLIIYYFVNYGYIDGILAADGEEQDAYILGIDHPVNEFTGTVVAIIHRLNDIEDKWVVAPENMIFSKEEIIKLTCFQEQYFDIEVSI